VFLVGVALASVAVIAYIWALRDPAQFMSNPRPGLIYRAGEGLIPHLQGFTLNPIYYSILLFPALLSGVILPVKGYGSQGLKLAACAFLGVTLVMTFSRGAVLALGLSALLLVIVFAFKSWITRYLWSLVGVLFLVVLVSSLVAVPIGGIKVSERLIGRFEIGRLELRYENYWDQLLPKVSESPLVGHGLRSANVALRGQYAENSYLELMYDTGLVGLVLWACFIGYVALVGWKISRRMPMLLPWLHSWVIIVIASFYASIQFDPLVWIVAGIVLGSGYRRDLTIGRVI